MLITASVKEPPEIEIDYEKRINGPDQGLINAWLVGLDKRKADPNLVSRAMAGELPPLVFKGGVAQKIQAKNKIGSLWYVAAWQGLRGEDLQINLLEEITLTCSRTGVPVTFTLDIKKISDTGDGDE